MKKYGSAETTDQIRWLAHGPKDSARRYTSYIVNGFRFHTRELERSLLIQNSCVVVKIKTRSHDHKLIVEREINHYGALANIIDLISLACIRLCFLDVTRLILMKVAWRTLVSLL